MGPGCAIPASRCQIDHQVAWEDGGRTELTNLAPLCQGHHTIRHHGGWVVRQLPGGAIEWISPLGRRYVEEPERRVPVFPAAGVVPTDVRGVTAPRAAVAPHAYRIARYAQTQDTSVANSWVDHFKF